MRPTILPLITKLYSKPQKSGGNTSINSLKSENPPIKSEEMYGIMEQKLRHACGKRGGNFLNESSVDILADLTHTQEEIVTVSKSTVKQWKSKEWYKHKSSFITGSIAQQSVNMQNSLDKGLERNVSSLVKKK
jgi:hypothetical protein